MSEKKFKGVALAIPSDGRDVNIHWALAIVALGYPVGMNRMVLVSVKDPNRKEHTRDMQREILCENALKAGAEFLMFIDDDTIPPPQTIQELWYVLSQNPNAAVAGGIYCTKQTIASPLVFMDIGAGSYWDWTVGDVFKCAALGTGCMMIRTRALLNIPKPWFQDTSESMLGDIEQVNDLEMRVTGRSGTDDIYFCKKVTDAGYDILAHGGVLPQHVARDENGVSRFYTLPTNSGPFTRYLEKQAQEKK